MRVTIEHSHANQDNFITTDVQFSEEEKAIIKHRNLGPTPLIAAATHPPTTLGEDALGFGIGFLALACFGSGFFWHLLAFLWKPWYSIWADILVIAGMPLLVIALVVRLKNAGRNLSQAVQFSVGNLLNGPLRLYAPTPADAKALDDQLRTQLQNLKSYIEHNREVRAKESFEL